jgi:mannosyltransferase OCH1-like enzyme
MNKSLLMLCMFLWANQNYGYERFGVQGMGVPFHEGMSNFEWYRPYWTQVDAQWRLAYDQYTNVIVNGCDYQIEPRIPKIIHQIWVGSPLPDKYISLIKSWQRYHPDWVYILWTDDDIKVFGLVNQDQYDATSNYGQKADIARYEILYRLGGVYVDIDFECLRPFDIFHHCCDYYTGVAYSGRFCVFNGLIGAAPNNPIMKGCIDTLDITAYYEGTPEHNILFTSGPFHQARNFVAHVKESGRAVAFPVNYFYPWPFSKKEDLTNIERWYRPETFAIHYWHAGWRHDKQDSLVDIDTVERGLWGEMHCWPYFTQSIFQWFSSMWSGFIHLFPDCESCSSLLS